MPYVDPLEFSQASEEAKTIWRQQEESYGKITNMKRTLAHNSSAFKSMMEWYSLKNEVSKFLDEISIYLFCQAISDKSKCKICDLYFIRLLKQKNIDPTQYKTNKKQSTLLRFAHSLTINDKKISPELMQKLNKYFTASELVSLTVLACFMRATNMFNNIIEVDLDQDLHQYDTKG